MPGALAFLRRHWLMSVLLGAGLLLRAASEVAYRPALIYVDTLKYLYGASPGADPLGYKAVLLAIGNLGIVALLQHLLGLAVGVVIYAVLLRRGVTRWLAAMAAGAVPLDAYQLQIEQTIMPDIWFNAMVVAGLAVLLWRPAVSIPCAAAAGLILGTSATVRLLGEILVLPAVVYLLAAGGGWRPATARAVALSAAFALPILCYCTVSSLTTGHFWLARQQSRSGRLAAAADCATLRLPADLRPLCPTPGEQAQGPDWLEHATGSPLHDAPIPPGASRDTLIAAFDAAVERQQPIRVAASIARDSVRLFAVTRTGTPTGCRSARCHAGPPGAPGLGRAAYPPRITAIARWQFQTSYPTYPPWVNVGRGNVIVVGVQQVASGRFRFVQLNRAYGGTARVDRPVAALLRAYQLGGGYTPGPLLAAFTLAGLAGSVPALARRRAGGLQTRQLALACLLFTVTAATVLLVPDVLEFSWRYQLPALFTLPPAGALGIGALLSSRQAHRLARSERVIALSDVAWLPGPRCRGRPAGVRHGSPRPGRDGSRPG